MDAYKRGYQDYNTGKSINNNPYFITNTTYIRWLTGWLEAKLTDIDREINNLKTSQTGNV